MESMREEQLSGLTEDNRLLESKLGMYREEIVALKKKLEYAGNLLSLYESIINCSKQETKDFLEEIKSLKNKNNELEKKIKVLNGMKSSAKKSVAKASPKKNAKKAVKKSDTKVVKKSIPKKNSKKTLSTK